MKRPFLIWLLFFLCFGVLLAALGWTSFSVVRLDRAAEQAQADAAREEDVRLALWRMDSTLAGLIAQENARPYFWYSSFYAADRPYTRMIAEPAGSEGFLASPLLGQLPPHVLLHFQMAADGRLASPQSPPEPLRKLACGFTTEDHLAAAAARLEKLRTTARRETILAVLPADAPQPESLVVAVQQPAGQNRSRYVPGAQQAFNTIEYQARAQASQLQNTDVSNSGNYVPGEQVRTGVLHPLWLGGQLLLVRRVTVNQDEFLQGCWLDWPALRQSLVAGIADLLPDASLEPVSQPVEGNRERMLAALPAALLPGPVPAAAIEAQAWLSPLRLSLIAAWAGALLAALAVAALLRGVLALSERRGAFVSAVTHELRTPLTTFRMYAEMLAEGMVPDEDARRRYLNTLRVEADRLSHLVENVLSYARLERVRHDGRVQNVPLADVLARVTPRLRDRLEQAEMCLEVSIAEPVLETSVLADSSAVEQILFNLVDNACKYAAGSLNGELREESQHLQTVHLEAERVNRQVVLRVRDHGPGITKAEGRRLFRPFSKSAHEAAVTAPGVGLGLALSRRLARAMHGDLRLENGATGGATFALTLPMAQ